MSPPALLLTNSPILSEKLRSKTDYVLARLIRTNYNSQFAQVAPELASFRDAIGGERADDLGDASISESFRKTAQFTTYDAYSPFFARFHEKPCRESAVANLFAPGLPDYLVRSSSTSGGTPKLFPKYTRVPETLGLSPPVPKRTTSYLFSFRCDSFDITDEDDRLVKRVYLSSATGVLQRGPLGLDPANDEERMGTFVSDYAAPFAAGFIKNWRSFLLIQALFALSSESLEAMRMAFISSFVDLMRHLDVAFDMIVDCIKNGTIPDLEGVEEVRRYLEPNMVANPKRATELRSIGRPSSRPGWCGHVWPELRSVTGIASGSFASSIPLARWFLGSKANILAYCYGSSEGLIGFPYNPIELNQFKLNSDIIVEFLDIKKNDSISSITQPWEVELGNRYEVVMTTPEGLWRYRIGDIVDIAGFDPKDGMPVMRFIERRNAALRFPYFVVTEEELRTAMMSVAANTLGNVVDWTTTLDDRQLPPTIGFFVELTGDEGKTLYSSTLHVSLINKCGARRFPVADAALAPQRLLDTLLRLNGMIPWTFEQGLFRKPTIRIVGPGAFSNFRQLKIEESTYGMGQVKIPVVLAKAAYVSWFSSYVVKEL